MGILIRLGANIAPFAMGWFMNDVPEYLDSLNPFTSDEDARAVAGWGLSSLLGILILIFLAFRFWKEFK